MVKEIDVGASQMGIEVLTNKGSKDNPTKSVELQKAPDKPYTIEEHSKMFEAMGNPEKAAELKTAAKKALTEEGKKVQKDNDEENYNLIPRKQYINAANDAAKEEQKRQSSETKEERRKKSRELADEYNRKQEAGEDLSQFEGEEPDKNPGGLEIAMRPKLAVNVMRVQFPLNVIDEFNTHIDDVVIPANVDAGGGLVGQIRQDKRSGQLTVDHNDDGVGKQLSDVLLRLGQEYMTRVTGMESETSMETMWTIHSYEGDYNPVHDHGTRTPMGLSCIMYLKVPPQIAELGNPSEEFEGLNYSSGAVDGFTYLTWGVNGMRDINILRPITEEYIKPDVGLLLMFPSWLRHGVMPFFGEGERRTFSANLNVTPKKKITGDYYRKHTPKE